MSESKVERLELQALSERNQLHKSVAELRSQVTYARENLDPARNIRKHFLGASITASLVGFVSGYGFAGWFAR